MHISGKLPKLGSKAFFRLALLLAAFAAPTVPADAMDLTSATSRNAFSISGVKSYAEKKYTGVVKQQYDFSCGSAALATLLTYHYGIPTPENKALKAMFAVGDQEKIKKEGFSLLDMKTYLATLGLDANGFRESLDKLPQAQIPALALINNKGYMHFVVIKGVQPDKVLIGDPAFGLKTVRREDFQKMWNGILFVVTNKNWIANNTFNDPKEWTLAGSRSPSNQPLPANLSLASFTIDLLPIPGYY